MERLRSIAGLIGAALPAFTALLLFAPTLLPARDMVEFDFQGEKIFRSYDEVPLSYMSAVSGDRTLNEYYSLRQYPGSPPRIPHPVDPSFAGGQEDCLSCHEKGGYSEKFDSFAPVTPHPENTLCYQCHAVQQTDELFVETEWRSIEPPRLGFSALGGSPPVIPHALQLRENCIACHAGPGAVVEIRVEHSARGNCRQCHVPLNETAPVTEFTRNP